MPKSMKLLGGGSLFRGIRSANYPKCQIFVCGRYHSGTVNNRCCFYCDKKTVCKDPCLNHPDRCSKCVKPKSLEGNDSCGN